MTLGRLQPDSAWSGPTDDDELIQRAFRSQSGRSIFGQGASFHNIRDVNESILSVAYPDPFRTYDLSAADAALAQHLAFWTGKNCERIERIMRRSGLIREKWDREDYLPRTILGACGRQKEVLMDRKPQSTQTNTDSQISLRPVDVTGATFLTIEQQKDLFNGCIYVTDEHKVLIPGGRLLSPERFTTVYGGFSFPMDNKNEYLVSKNAFKAFTQNQAFRGLRAEGSCFRPDRQYGELIVKDGLRLANLWWPISPSRSHGDPFPFLNHITKMVPDRRDQLILISYLA